jgi:ATP-binding cassette subfamily B protein
MAHGPAETAASDPTAQDLPPSKAELSRILRLMLPNWRISTLLLVTIGVSAACSMVPVLLIRQIVDDALTQQDATQLYILIAGIFAAAVVGGAAFMYRDHLSIQLGQKVVFALRCRLYENVLGQSLDFFKKTRVGDITSRLAGDVEGIHGVVSGTLLAAFANVVLGVCTLVVAFVLNWRLALIAMVLLPLFTIPARKIGAASRILSREAQELVAKISSIATETLSIGGFLLVRLFGAERRAVQHFSSAAGELRTLAIRRAHLGRWFIMWIMLFLTVGPALIYLIGGHEVIAGRMTVGTLVAFVALFGQIFGPASALAGMHVEIMGAVALFRRVFEFLDLPPSVADPARPVPLPASGGRLRFEKVSLSYESGSMALKDISFEAAPGQMVALVGPSGAGKTSTAYLASRIYDPIEGSVSLDGIDLRQISLSDLSDAIGAVTQEATLFNASIAENLRYAKADASDEELIRVCKLAQVHETIAALPQGYSTLVGERGYAFSGGERQRLSIARALLRNSRVLILDEATSSLDSQSEALIQSALNTALSGRTSLVIAHRLSTILRADLILVLDRGVIVQRGTHADLMKQGGLYARLFAIHFQQPDDGDTSKITHLLPAQIQN